MIGATFALYSVSSRYGLEERRKRFRPEFVEIVEKYRRNLLELQIKNTESRQNKKNDGAGRIWIEILHDN